MFTVNRYLHNRIEYLINDERSFWDFWWKSTHNNSLNQLDLACALSFLVDSTMIFFFDDFYFVSFERLTFFSRISFTTNKNWWARKKETHSTRHSQSRTWFDTSECRGGALEIELRGILHSTVSFFYYRLVNDLVYLTGADRRMQTVEVLF